MAKKHDHRGSLWIIGGGAILWCYQCGAWRPNVAGKMQWHKHVGIGGQNPASYWGTDVRKSVTGRKI